MNILYLGNAQGFDNASKYYMIPQKLINGFTRLGHNVYVLNDRDYSRASNVFRSSKLGVKHVNRKVLDVISDYRPDLIILGHCKNITNGTLEEVRLILPNAKIIYRNVDPLHSQSNLRDIHSRTGFVDGIFITTAGDALNQFAGGDTFTTFMPNPIDPSIETGRAFENEGDYDLFFAGSFLRDQHDQRHDLLVRLAEELTDLRLGFFGANLGAEKVFGRNYLDRMCSSKMGLCLNKTSDFYLYASDRMAQYMGQGLLVFIDRGPQFEDVLGEDEAVFYESADELIKKVRYFNDNDAERRAVAKKGWETAHRLFNCEKVAKYIVEQTFCQALTGNYGWPTSKYHGA